MHVYACEDELEENVYDIYPCLCGGQNITYAVIPQDTLYLVYKPVPELAFLKDMGSGVEIYCMRNLLI